MADPDQAGNRHDEHAVVLAHPSRPALLLAAIFLVFGAVYIGLSGRWAATSAASVAELEHIELVKGLAFVAVCAALLFLTAWLLLRRIARSQADILSHRSALLAAERRAMAGAFASSVAHDMNNIMTVGVATTDLLLGQKSLTPDQRAMLRDIEATFARMGELTQRLSLTGRASLRGDLQQADLVAVLREELAFARRHARLRSCSITLLGATTLTLQICPLAIQQMLVNLLLNAAEAAGERARIEVRVTRDGDRAIVEVHDNGPGIPADLRAGIFEAFYTTKAQGRGLGLMSAKAAVQIHRGRIEALESPLGGACLRMALPIRSQAAPPPAVTA